MTTTRILIVDEDNDALTAYRETLAPKASKWETLYAPTAEAGLACAKEKKPDIVIVAYSVNQDQGAALLEEIEAILPDSQRFITATSAQKPALESTFGSSFQFLPNPCPAVRLVTEIQRCVAIDTWLGNERIKQLVARMGTFPSLPPLYLKVVNALNSRNASAQSIAEAISGDLAISAKVLQTVNSSYYGFDEKISNITQAVSILGTECVKNLVLAIQVFDRLAKDANHRALTDQLWHHSMSVAVAARRITLYETSDEKAAEEAYTAGLMHDIGKLVLLNAAPEATEKARQLAHEKSVPLWEAESQAIGCHHAETGAYVLARWGMPAALAEAVALHHEPINSFGKSFSSLAAVHVANAIVHSRQDPEHPSAAISPEYLSEIGRGDSWETWQAVASGKTPRLKLSKHSETASSDSSQPTEKPQSTAAKNPSPARPSPRATESDQPASSRKPLIALACSVAFAAAGIYFTSTLGDSKANATTGDASEARNASPASAIEQARQLSGLTQTEDALQDIFDSQESAVPKPTPKPELAETAPPPSPTQQPTPDLEQTPQPEPKASLPQPQLAETKDTFPEIILSGIFYNAERPLASVNGQIRRVGDTVNGARIVRIEKSRILVQHENLVRSFKLN